jgi:hypothetical protein
MSDVQDGPVTRGAAEEASGAPLTETEIETSLRPASQPPSEDGGDGGTTDSDAVAAAAESLGSGSDQVEIEPLEERPEVVAAIQDDTTAPGLADNAS